MLFVLVLYQRKHRHDREKTNTGEEIAVLLDHIIDSEFKKGLSFKRLFG